MEVVFQGIHFIVIPPSLPQHPLHLEDLLTSSHFEVIGMLILISPVTPTPTLVPRINFLEEEIVVYCKQIKQMGMCLISEFDFQVA